MWKRAECRGERSQAWTQPPAGRLNSLGQSLTCAGLVRTFELYSPPRITHLQPRFLRPSLFYFNHLLSSPWLKWTSQPVERRLGWRVWLRHIQRAGSQRRLTMTCRSTSRTASVWLVARGGLTLALHIVTGVTVRCFYPIKMFRVLFGQNLWFSCRQNNDWSEIFFFFANLFEVGHEFQLKCNQFYLYQASQSASSSVEWDNTMRICLFAAFACFDLVLMPTMVIAIK